MYEMRAGRYYFILIDFDMAVSVPDDPDAMSTSLTVQNAGQVGTLTFMAYELVESLDLADWKDWTPVRHRLAHEYQSLFFVALWCIYILVTAGLDEKQKERLRQRVRSWSCGSYLNILAAKKVALTVDLEDDRGGRKVSEDVQPLFAWMEAWANIHREVQVQRSERIRAERRAAAASARRGDGNEDAIAEEDPLPPYDEETEGGLLSRDNLKEKLTPHMPFQQDTAGIDLETAPGQLPEDEDTAEAVEVREVTPAGHTTPVPGKPSRTAVPPRGSQGRRRTRPPAPPESDIRLRLRSHGATVS